MRIERVVLEDHRDVAVLRLDVVHQLVADPQLTARDLLQTGDHAQGGGLTAAGGADEHDELLVGDLEVELLHGDDALVGDLEIDLLLGLALLGLFLLLGVGVDLLDVLQNNLCHNASDCNRAASARTVLRPVKMSGTPYGRSPHCRTASHSGTCSSFDLPVRAIGK